MQLTWLSTCFAACEKVPLKATHMPTPINAMTSTAIAAEITPSPFSSWALRPPGYRVLVTVMALLSLRWSIVKNGKKGPWASRVQAGGAVWPQVAAGQSGKVRLPQPPAGVPIGVKHIQRDPRLQGVLTCPFATGPITGTDGSSG